MRIKVNGKETEFIKANLFELLTEMEIPLNGLAVAVGSKIIPRNQWNTHVLKENDEVMLIGATRGG
ncbi:sulfur carrier protein ThiS [Alkalitalea saponilacus]|uniref:Sulfur carrier protein n=1 Tax=Alkalitalea saponilacus TaxID=889453 RepID=A0A1T5HS36_9BACT|nr:sulfur carrier protein ThiS [Alkalitalea saponilacus]ASB49989.1 thiamine biosynthesis protein ThiS [Alkalitalea saponilacus]SKC23503.1 sulfur carrier protein [Alkalitalea saponilacus]